MDYTKLTAVLTEAVKELQIENQQLKKELIDLRSLVENMLAHQTD